MAWEMLMESCRLKGPCEPLGVWCDFLTVAPGKSRACFNWPYVSDVCADLDMNFKILLKYHDTFSLFSFLPLRRLILIGTNVSSVVHI